MGHLLAAGLSEKLEFPALGLLVSGGHTNIYYFASAVKSLQLGRTIDDAAGEAFDKTGKILGLAYPGGRLLDTLARRGRGGRKLFPGLSRQRQSRFQFQRPQDGCVPVREGALCR